MTAHGRLHEVVVPVEWIDYNGHVNDSRHFQMTSETVDRFLELIGADAEYRASGHSWFTVESRMRFVAQAYEGDHLYGLVQPLSCDDKRLRVVCVVRKAIDDSEVCNGEHLLLHVDTVANRVVPAPDAMRARVTALLAD